MDYYERRDIERKLKRLREARLSYGIQAYNALTFDRFEHFEKLAKLKSKQIQDLEDKLEKV